MSEESEARIKNTRFAPCAASWGIFSTRVRYITKIPPLPTPRPERAAITSTATKLLTVYLTIIASPEYITRKAKSLIITVSLSLSRRTPPRTPPITAGKIILGIYSVSSIPPIP